MVFLAILIGAILGGLLLDEEGILPGMMLGYLVFQSQVSRKKMTALGERVDLLQERLRRLVREEDEPMESKAPVAPSRTEPVAPLPREAAPIDLTPPIEDPLLEPSGAPFREQPPGEEPPAAAPPPETHQTTDVVEEWAARLKEVVLGGNLIARIGVGILFVGLSFLIKLAIENSLFPIELRLAGAGLLGAGMIGFGWRFASTRKGYGVSLQGGGIAIIFLTVFASFRLYSLIPSQAAFVILVLVTVLGATIAVLQDSQTLAVLSTLGGFLAPVIASTGEGSHVALFTYYAVLNAGILAIAWHRPWRLLFLTGFFSTFGIGTAWGGLNYVPDYFATTEPFLILFFVFYVSIALLYALRFDITINRLVDGTLVFGLPVVVFSLQAILVDPYPFGLAWSALAFGGFYAVVAWILFQRKPAKLRMLVESFSGIGLALISMTIPFALNATWTGAGWALEGAALVWLGIRQERMLVRAGGLLLLLLASATFFHGLEHTSITTRADFEPLFNPHFMGFLSLSLSSLFAAYQWHRHRDKLPIWEPFIGLVFLAAGVLWWLTGGFTEIEREVASAYRMQSIAAFGALSAIGYSFVGARLRWNALMRSTLFLIPLLFGVMVLNSIFSHPFANYGFGAWLFASGSMFAVLYRLEDRMPARYLGFFHALALWTVTLLALIEGYWALDHYTDTALIWSRMAYFIAPLTAVFVVLWLDSTGRWPLRTHREAYLKLGTIPILAVLWIASLAFSFESSADPAPLPYVPLLNPLDITLGLCAFTGLYWYRAIQTPTTGPRLMSATGPRVLLWVLIATAFVWLNATIGRTVHHWAGIPYTDNLFDASIFQTALSVCWTLLAVTTMAIAAKREARTPWLVAAGLLGVVIVKLFAVDLSSLQTVHRVVSFIVVGLMLLLIGYVAPVPPKSSNEKLASTNPEEDYAS